MRLVATVPATVANLGPGFDCLALAVEIRNEFVLDTSGAPAVTVEGEGAGEVPENETNLIVRAMSALAVDIGAELAPFALRCRNAIPLARGLGSSAAAVVGGLVLADRLLHANVGSDRLLQLAVGFERHADNVAACLQGGLTVAYETRDGWRAAKPRQGVAVRPVLLVPDTERMTTAEARQILPAEVPLAAASANAARTALIVLGLIEQPDLLPDALDDRLHQRRRLEVMPATRAAFQTLRAGGVPVCLAGSGPSLLAFESQGVRMPDLGPGWRVLRPAVAAAGAAVVEA